MRTVLMGGVFDELSQLVNLESEPTVKREEYTTEGRTGTSFERILADETTEKISREVERELGIKIQPDDPRPWPGAFSIVSEQIVGAWMAMLEANGLRRFGDRITVDWFTKAYPLKKGKIEVKKTPIGSQPSFRIPRSKKTAVTMFFRLAVVDPRFLNADRKPAYKDLPKGYIVAVLNTLNPYVLYQLFGKDLPELLTRAGNYAQSFEQLLKVVAGKWKGKATPDDYETLQDYLHLGLIHEMVHALALHLPDEVPADSPELEAISYDKYLEIINSDKTLQTSVVFFKNLLKALQRTENKPVTPKTASKVIDILTLEMLCDRFSMFLYENFLKMKIYNEVVENHLGYPVNINMYQKLEEVHHKGKLKNRFEISHLDPSALAKLQEKLQIAEQHHVYIRIFGDPSITKAEREFYWGFLNWLNILDSKNKILRFDMQHANSSRFMHVSVEGLVKDES